MDTLPTVNLFTVFQGVIWKAVSSVTLEKTENTFTYETETCPLSIIECAKN